jgi:hypothetical protein
MLETRKKVVGSAARTGRGPRALNLVSRVELHTDFPVFDKLRRLISGFS